MNGSQRCINWGGAKWPWPQNTLPQRRVISEGWRSRNEDILYSCVPSLSLSHTLRVDNYKQTNPVWVKKYTQTYLTLTESHKQNQGRNNKRLKLHFEVIVQPCFYLLRTVSKMLSFILFSDLFLLLFAFLWITAHFMSMKMQYHVCVLRSGTWS